MTKSSLYLYYMDMKHEVEKHKWLESEKVGYDIGFERALVDWMLKHRKAWLDAKKHKPKEK